MQYVILTCMGSSIKHVRPKLTFGAPLVQLRLFRTSVPPIQGRTARKRYVQTIRPSVDRGRGVIETQNILRFGPKYYAPKYSGRPHEIDPPSPPPI